MRSFDDQNSNSKFIFSKNLEDSFFKLKNEDPVFIHSNRFQNHSRPFGDTDIVIYEPDRMYSNPFGLQQAHQPIQPPLTKIKKQDQQADQQQDSRKGLRYLALRVSELLKQLQVATYREVSGLLVGELVPQNLTNTYKLKEEKNIKRRVYDALNVLISVGVIEKRGKSISIREQSSVGMLYANSGKCLTNNNWDNLKTLQKETDELHEKIQLKSKALDGLCRKYIALTKLHNRNKKREKPQNVLMFPIVGLVTTGKEILVQARDNSLLMCSTNKLQTVADLDLVKDIFHVEKQEIDNLKRSLGWDI